jgi:hypothetical protein
MHHVCVRQPTYPRTATHAITNVLGRCPEHREALGTHGVVSKNSMGARSTVSSMRLCNVRAALVHIRTSACKSRATSPRTVCDVRNSADRNGQEGVCDLQTGL